MVVGELSQAIDERKEHLMETGETDVGFELDACSTHHTSRIPYGRCDRVEQRCLSDSRLTDQQQRSAVRGARVDEPSEDRKGLVAPDQGGFVGGQRPISHGRLLSLDRM